MPAEPRVVFRDVSFRFHSSSDMLFERQSLHFPTGFTGVVGANGSGKSTLLRLAVGELEAVHGSVERPATTLYCAQRTDEPPAELSLLLQAYDADAYALRGRLGIEDDFVVRWDTLSHGERKRAQIGSALWQEPELLAIDEPSNHIDGEARELLLNALLRYRGVGLLVSHDRDLLDSLCTRCLWIDAKSTQFIPGGYTESSEQRSVDRETARAEHGKARKEHDRIKRETVVRREQASRSHRDRSKRGLSIKDHDARFKKNLARVTGKDSQAGRLLRQLDGRGQRAEDRLRDATVEKTVELGIWFEGERSARNTLFQLEAGSVPCGFGVGFDHPELSMRPGERVAVTGPNGAGKTTLIERIVAGVNVAPKHLTWIPQEIGEREGALILDQARALPKDILGRVMNVVSRLGSTPSRLLASTNPSPGELRKLMLALGMARVPHLIVMDEPTNHLDLPSIECLEAALADCPCGLLLVSHDERFLAKLIRTRWEIGVDGLRVTSAS